jgi:protein-disulfide isomerase
MAINTYEESFFDVLKNNYKIVIAAIVLISLIVLGVLGIRWYTNRNEVAGAVDQSGIIRDYNFYSGSQDSKLKMVYILDLQCPFCKENNPSMVKIKEDNKDKVQVVYKFLPLPIHSFAKPAGYAAYAAGEQGKFFEYIDRVFALQDQLNNSTLESIARELDLDYDKWNSSRNSAETRNKVEQDKKDIEKIELPKSTYGEKSKVNSTPTTILIKEGKIVEWWSGSPNVSNVDSNAGEIQSRIDKQL